MKTFSSVLVLTNSAIDQIKIDQALKNSNVTNNIYMAQSGEEAILLFQDSIYYSVTTKSIDSHMLIVINFSTDTQGLDLFLNYIINLNKEMKENIILVPLKENLIIQPQKRNYSTNQLQKKSIGFYQTLTKGKFQNQLQKRLSVVIESLDSVL